MDQKSTASFQLLLASVSFRGPARNRRGLARRVMNPDALAGYDVVLTTYSIVQGEHSARFR